MLGVRSVDSRPVRAEGAVVVVVVFVGSLVVGFRGSSAMSCNRTSKRSRRGREMEWPRGDVRERREYEILEGREESWGGVSGYVWKTMLRTLRSIQKCMEKMMGYFHVWEYIVHTISSKSCVLAAIGGGMVVFTSLLCPCSCWLCSATSFGSSSMSSPEKPKLNDIFVANAIISVLGLVLICQRMRNGCGAHGT